MKLTPSAIYQWTPRVQTATTSGSAVDVDADNHTDADVEATASFTLNVPTGGTNKQKFTWFVWNNSGSPITVTAAAGFLFGDTVTALGTVDPGEIGIFGAIYNTLGGSPGWCIPVADRGYPG